MVASRRSWMVMGIVLLVVTVWAGVLWGRTDSQAHWAEVGSSATPLSVWQAAELAARVYQPDNSPLPAGLMLLQTVTSSTSGLYAEFLVARPSPPAVQVAGAHLIVVIRGLEMDKLLTSREAFLADLGAAFGGGRPQWETLQDPLANCLQSGRVTRVTLIGHSLGGMVAQLAALECLRTLPELAFSVFTFNSPGVLPLLAGDDASAVNEASGRLQMTHVVHMLDTVPRLSLFGSHHRLTQWHLLDNATNSPHSMANILAYLETHDGLVPEPMSPEQIQAYLAGQDESR